jgi:beta-galactosidase GanA
MRRRLPWLLTCLICTHAHAQQPKHKPFLIGAEWQVDAAPAVKELFWETGCNFARLSGGGYGWITDAHKRALEELQAHGVRALLQLSSHYPDASFFDLKDAYLMDQEGKTGTPSKQSWSIEYQGQSWPQYSYGNEQFRTMLRQNFEKYFASLGPLPDVEAILVHNEPGYFWLDNRIFDYSTASISWFRKWLPSQYGSVEGLNSRWNSHYHSFAEVEPPHEVPPKGSLAAWMDWRRGNVAEIQEFLEWERSLCRQLHPEIPISTNLPGPIDNWYPIHLSDDYSFAQGQDISSIDIYPGADYTSEYFPGYSADMARSAGDGKRTFVAECESYAPEHFPKLTDQERAERLTGDLWTYIGHGANAISIWTWNGEDGFKMTKGEFNARVAAVRDTAYTAKMLNLGDFHRRASPVALVVDRNSYLTFHGNQDARAAAQHAYATALGMYGAVVQSGYETDVISSDMVRTGNAGRYRVLVLCSPETMDLALAARLKDFVRNGGLIITDSSLASYDNWGKSVDQRPGFGLDEVCGVRVGETTETNERVLAGKWSFDISSRTKLNLTAAKANASFGDGSAAVSANHFDKGTFIVIAGNAGEANSRGDEHGLGAAMASWIDRYAAAAAKSAIDSGNSYFDRSELVDDSGNRLKILTQQLNGSGPATLVKNLPLDLGPVPERRFQTFLLQDPGRPESRTVSGPRIVEGPLPSIQEVGSHAEVLLACDHTPLLATNSPQTLPLQGKGEVIVTVYNPSPRNVSGNLGLNAPDGWTVGSPFALKLAPFQQKNISFSVKAGGQGGRAVVRAVLTSDGLKIDSLPFDIDAGPKA